MASFRTLPVRIQAKIMRLAGLARPCSISFSQECDRLKEVAEPERISSWELCIGCVTEVTRQWKVTQLRGGVHQCTSGTQYCNHQAIPVSLLRLNRELHRLAIHILYSENHFYIDSQDLVAIGVLRKLSSFARQSITNVHVAFDGKRDVEFSPCEQKAAARVSAPPTSPVLHPVVPYRGLVRISSLSRFAPYRVACSAHGSTYDGPTYTYYGPDFLSYRPLLVSYVSPYEYYVPIYYDHGLPYPHYKPIPVYSDKATEKKALTSDDVAFKDWDSTFTESLSNFHHLCDLLGKASRQRPGILNLTVSANVGKVELAKAVLNCLRQISRLRKFALNTGNFPGTAPKKCSTCRTDAQAFRKRVEDFVSKVTEPCSFPFGRLPVELQRMVISAALPKIRAGGTVDLKLQRLDKSLWCCGKCCLVEELRGRCYCRGSDSSGWSSSCVCAVGSANLLSASSSIREHSLKTSHAKTQFLVQGYLEEVGAQLRTIPLSRTGLIRKLIIEIDVDSNWELSRYLIVEVVEPLIRRFRLNQLDITLDIVRGSAWPRDYWGHYMPLHDHCVTVLENSLDRLRLFGGTHVTSSSFSLDSRPTDIQDPSLEILCRLSLTCAPVRSA